MSRRRRARSPVHNFNVRTACCLVLSSLILPSSAAAQQPPPADAPRPPRVEETVDVVAATPIEGLGLPREKVAANVQVFRAGALGAGLSFDVPALLNARAAGVHTSEAQGGTFQPDLQFRGFVGSPLLGASEGLAVYQDGVRVNEAFGDTINWDAVPGGAMASLTLMPGSNPLFGLNALGGALSIRMKDGFSHPGRRASFTTGAFGRHHVEAEAGGAIGAVSYFVAGDVIDEAGWRDHSPSTLRRLFGNVGWLGRTSQVTTSLTVASNDMIGNGPAPIGLLDADRSAVFTHPDRTDNDLTMVTVRGRRQPSDRTVFEAVAYYRHGRVSTFNGDAADEDDDAGEEDGDAGGIGAFDAVNNLSRTRTHAAGVTGQASFAADLAGRDNHFVLGAGVDSARSRFDFAAEFATLTPDRGTSGHGLFDDEAAVNLHSRTTTAGAFFTNTWSAGARVAITGSARLNWTDVALRDQLGAALTGDHRFVRLNPGVGVTYQVRPAVNLYGSYTQSSRVPTPVELTCADPEDPCRLPNAFVSDPPLNQIVAGTWEGGARGTARGVTWSVAAFWTLSTDDIIFVSSGTLRGEGHFENVERTRRAGVEASVEIRAGRVVAFGAYTVQRAVFGVDLTMASQFHPRADGAEIAVSAGSRLPGVPAHSAKVGIEGSVGGGVQVGVTMRAQSAQYLRGDEANLLDPLSGFAVVNAEARRQLTSRVTIIGRVQNVFDAKYATFGVLGDAELLGEAFEDDPRFVSAGAPRAGWIGLDVRF
jgi:outer membrane receptor protein involved in Fe transport